MRVVFAGTPAFASVSLKALIEAADIDVVGVLTQPDRPAGRGMKPAPSPVKRMALDAGIEVRTPDTLRDNDEILDWLRKLAPDVLIVVAYGLLLPRPVLEVPRVAPVNVHASLLPRWRGAAPIERAMLAGDSETGVCLMRMEEGLDTGPVYARRAIPIDDRITGGALRERLARLGAELLVETLPAIAEGLKPEPQPEVGVTYAAKLTPADRRIDWEKDAGLVDRVVRCFAPKPGARTTVDGRWIKILAGRPDPVQAGEPGSFTPEGEHLRVACGRGSFLVELLQPEGKRTMRPRDWLLGARLSHARFK